MSLADFMSSIPTDGNFLKKMNTTRVEFPQLYDPPETTPGTNHETDPETNPEANPETFETNYTRRDDNDREPDFLCDKSRNNLSEAFEYFSLAFGKLSDYFAPSAAPKPNLDTYSGHKQLVSTPSLSNPPGPNTSNAPGSKPAVSTPPLRNPNPKPEHICPKPTVDVPEWCPKPNPHPGKIRRASKGIRTLEQREKTAQVMREINEQKRNGTYVRKSKPRVK